MESANTQSPGPAAPAARRRLLVTGAGRGIGAAVAVMAARRGWDVAINYARDTVAAERTAEAVRAAGGRALLLPADVADDGAVVAMFGALDAAWGGLDDLVNNAGVVDVAQRVDEYSAARVQRMFAINVFGSFSCAREAVKRLSTRHGGTGGAIVNIGSVASKIGSAGQYVDYAAAKGAIDVFTVGLSREVAAEGVRVNCVRPGITDTEIHASGGQPERAWQLAPMIPMQRPGTADEIAESVLWLLSDAAAYTTGALLDVTGGR